MRPSLLVLAAFAVLASGCNDSSAPRDVTPPAAPRGLVSVTGDGEVYLSWLGNTERDVAGYRVYMSPCDGGPGCPYDLQGQTTGTNFVVRNLPNGVTRFFAVAAYDASGNESDLSYEDIFDTPRPEGFGAVLNNFENTSLNAGWDFSAAGSYAWNALNVDMFYGYDDVSQVATIFVPDFQTDIQDAGWASSLDAVDFSPATGWAPSGSVELIVGHCYVVWTRDNHYAKFRVTEVGPNRVVFDWAYQVDAGNRELRAKRASEEGAGRRPLVWPRGS